MEEIKTRMRRGKRRPVAGRGEILAAARAIGMREGWKSVTIRSVGQQLGYASPLMYEHFKDKEDLLTQIALQTLAELEAELTRQLPPPPLAALTAMLERYWQFMQENTQLYRLINGMAGVPIDNDALAESAQTLCHLVSDTLRPVVDDRMTDSQRQELADDLWALLHGMAALYLDRGAPFDLDRVTRAAFRLIQGSGS